MNLLPHQIETLSEAMKVLEAHNVVYISAECRTGKSGMALELCKRLVDQFGGQCLIVTPKNAIASILADAFRFIGEGWSDWLTVVNRESLHKVVVPSGDFLVVVTDESHRDGAFPKPSQSLKLLIGIKRRYSILMSGTPSVETGAQLFHQFWQTGRGPWAAYRSFYKWHVDWGIPAEIRIAGGQVVKDYSQVRPEVVSTVGKYCVTLTQENAGFKYFAEVKPVFVEDPDLLKWCKQFEVDGIATVASHVVLGENPAALLQKMHMVLGGTLIDENGESFRHSIGSSAKARMLTSKLSRDRQYFVSTAYIEEREFLAWSLRGAGFVVTTEYEEFLEYKKTGGPCVFVGSGISYAEGIDLSWMTGCHIIYSLNFSGAKYLQLLERQNKFDRDRPIHVYVLMVKGSVDELVFRAVSEKRNFNASFYKGVRC